MNPVYVEVELQQNNYEVFLDVNENKQEIPLDVDIVVTGGGHFPWYDGGGGGGDAYTVTPQIDEQVLPTKNKSMAEDLTIEAIPYSEVPNPSGGQTVCIAFD